MSTISCIGSWQLSEPLLAVKPSTGSTVSGTWEVGEADCTVGSL